ncbi:RHS repeat domain-containing protein [Micromonospora sp. NPDC000663]|uniref:RHS repeat domain-containing protein n=1 Tax=Micromonospora sp. NPDC000663 TaxID=3364218 RepID=UPI003685D261
MDRPQKEPLVRGSHAQPVPPRRPQAAPPRVPAAEWPSVAAVDVSVPATGSRRVRAGDLPLWVQGTGASGTRVSKVRVRSLSRKGVRLSVARADGGTTAAAARVTVDIRDFRSAYGGDWASRLRLWREPDCAASGCRPQPLTSDVDLRAGTVSAEVSLAGAVPATLALAAADNGPGGDYRATSLAPSATWSTGGNTGDFSWSYPLRVPPPTAGPSPVISLGYSSSSVDGRTAAANSQPSWIGDGFDWHPGYIERRYTSCSKDIDAGSNNKETSGDLCWKTDNAVLSMPGRAGEMLKDGDNGSRWHLRRDDGTYIERRTGARNGDNNGEWWVARTPDGTEYWFGGRDGSQSTLTVPVFGNHQGEDCRQSTFAASSCVQAYRWQLDHVVDTHGNTMRFNYTKETNRYARNNTQTDAVDYDRAGYPANIEYGTRLDSADNAPYRVEFALADRCLSGCTDPRNWPDVPRDLSCAASPCSAQQGAPTFWMQKRLSAVTTRVWDAAANDYQNVERWGFTHSYPNLSDGPLPALWLSSISHTGLVGVGVSTPAVSFVPVVRGNRVDTNSDQLPAMNRPRIQQIISETGGVTDVTYSDKECATGATEPDRNALHANTLRCYPVRWTPPGHTSPITDFFHKYVVTQVAESDKIDDRAKSPRVLTTYAYKDAAWRYTDDDGLIDADAKTWSVWRGYRTVVTTKGEGAEATRTETRYFQGMHGDKTKDGTRSVSMPAISTGEVPAVNDEDAFAGQVREQITYNGSAEVAASVTEPWQSDPTASRTINGSTVNARYTAVGAEYTRTALDGGRGHRTTTQRSTRDAYGMVSKLDDNGDNDVTGDEKCVLTDYARNTDKWIIDRESRERTFAASCAVVGDLGAGGTAENVIGDVRTSYDQLAWSVAPTAGEVSEVRTLKEFKGIAGADSTFITENRYTHDALGRVYEQWDIHGARTVHGYTTAAGGGPVTQLKQTNALGWVTTTQVEPAWGVPVKVTDPNGRVTETAYDGLGRVTGMWLPGRARSTWPTDPSHRFSYSVREDRASVITTQRINQDGKYVTSYAFFDGLLRARQTQAPDGAGSTGVAVVTDTRYDTAGRVSRVHNPYVALAAPSATLYVGQGIIPSVTVREYDGAGRLKVQAHVMDSSPASPGGERRWQTTYGYGGDRQDVTPPAGGVVTSTVKDAQGRTVKLRRYGPGVAAGSASGYDETTYRYSARDKLEKVTAPLGVVWQRKYDLRGREIETIDPDLGRSALAYNDEDELLTRTDARGQTEAYTYDDLGRRTTSRVGSVTGAVRAQWRYDQTIGKVDVRGQLVGTTRYEGGDAYQRDITSFQVDYQPTGVRYTIPGTGPLSGTYDYAFGYYPNGSPKTVRLPGVEGDLETETLTYTYDTLGLPETLVADDGLLVKGVDHTSFSETAATHLTNGDGGPSVDVLRTYETDTRRLDTVSTTRSTSPTAVTDVNYDYDDVGNVVRAADTNSSDNQCYRYDKLRRLSDAWTPADGKCTTAPENAILGGPAKYRHSYRYDAAGNRSQLVEYGAGSSGTNRTTTYTIAAGTHKIAGTTVTDGSATPRTTAFQHDATGNITGRPAPGGNAQTLTWTLSGKLASSQDTTGTTTYLYDSDDQRLIRQDPAGQTLYLPGQEIRAASGAVKVIRYYSHNRQTVATRTAAGGLVWLVADHQGTTQSTIAAGTGQAVAIRRQTPFGVERTGKGAWPSFFDKGFVGGTEDNSGLTHLGAREYDPSLGRFISVDPLIDVSDPEQMNGYNYANNSPVTLSDPDGLIPRSCPDGECPKGQVGAPKRANNPATTYNPPVKQRVNRKVNCPDGAQRCQVAYGATTRRPVGKHGAGPTPQRPNPVLEDNGTWSMSLCLGASFQALVGKAAESCTVIDSKGFGWATSKKNYYGPGFGMSGTLGLKVANTGVKGLAGGETSAGGNARLGVADVGLEGGVSDDGSWAVGGAVGPGLGGGYSGFMGRSEANSDYYFKWPEPRKIPYSREVITYGGASGLYGGGRSDANLPFSGGSYVHGLAGRG